jgi:hypothetical protein
LALLDLFAMPKKIQDIGYIAYAVFEQMDFLLD